ncbi:MAG: hypothetical protein NVSMB38_39720 [Ktedonobacteraceae bacterium]
MNMVQAHVWTGRELQPAALMVLEGVASLSVTRVGERNDWYAEAVTADAIIVAGETFVTSEVMDRIGPRLRIIARTGIGVDRIDLDAATERGILVVNTPDGPTESTAEHAIGHHPDSCVEKRKRQANRRLWNSSLSKRKKLVEGRPQIFENTLTMRKECSMQPTRW